jgi:hypothetical protein
MTITARSRDRVGRASRVQAIGVAGIASVHVGMNKMETFNDHGSQD